ncbi:MAG TPA: MaoC family dehydratase [Desulfobulbus sp.]|nr:MaoC family dehydratase [Desulfobulbus sp.]
MPTPTVIAEKTIDDFSIGQEFSFSVTITKSDVERFAQLSGDINPLHMDDGFAEQRGFKGRVVHGLLLSGYLSRLVGVHFPGRHALLHGININFLSPAYVNDTVNIECIVNQISLSTRIIILKVVMKNLKNNNVLLRAKVQVGFTQTNGLR